MSPTLLIADAFCSVDLCTNNTRTTKGMCPKHYMRWRKYGTPLIENRQGRPAVSVAERFWPKVKKTGSCWIWTASLDEHGYGRLNTHRNGAYVNGQAHRISYEICVGPIPQGLQIDHLCRNTSCVNPKHLEPVTPSENIKRAVPFRRLPQHQEFCPQGHKRSNKYNSWMCLVCNGRNARANYWLKKFGLPSHRKYTTVMDKQHAKNQTT